MRVRKRSRPGGTASCNQCGIQFIHQQSRRPVREGTRRYAESPRVRSSRSNFCQVRGGTRWYTMIYRCHEHVLSMGFTNNRCRSPYGKILPWPGCGQGYYHLPSMGFPRPTSFGRTGRPAPPVDQGFRGAVIVGNITEHPRTSSASILTTREDAHSWETPSPGIPLLDILHNRPDGSLNQNLSICFSLAHIMIISLPPSKRVIKIYSKKSGKNPNTSI